MKNTEITDQKLDKYFDITKRALDKVKITIKDSEKKNIALDFLQMASNYYSDAKHFREKGDYVSAFGALNYAHAWLDAGARMKIFDVNDQELFAAD